MKFLSKFFFFPIRFFLFSLKKLSIFRKKPEYLYIEIPSNFQSSIKSSLLDLFSQNQEVIYFDFIRTLKELLEIKTLKTLGYKVNEVQFGYAECFEIADILRQLKSNGVYLKSFSIYGDLKTLYLNSIANERFALNSSEFMFVMPSIETFFWGSFFKKVGVEIEIYSSGKFKSFGEPYSKDKFSLEARENLTILIRSLKEKILNELHQNTNYQWESFTGPILHSDQLKEVNIINDFVEETDFVSYYYLDKIPNSDTENEMNLSKSKDISYISKYISQKKYKLFKQKEDTLYVLPLKGNIVMGKEKEIERTEGNISAISVIHTLRELKKQKDVKYLLIEIDSGGGSAFASELIYKEIISLRKDVKVYAYFQNVSASGGYYLGCACEKIFSNEYCITGSIGTIMMRPNLKGLYDKYGVKKDRIEFYPGREILSEYGKLSKPSKDILQKEIDRVKNQFYKRVTDSRNISGEELESRAGGRVFLAPEFLKLGMLDDTKTFLGTIEWISKENNIENLKVQYMVPVYTIKSMIKNFTKAIQFIQNPIKSILSQSDKLEMYYISEFSQSETIQTLENLRNSRLNES
jgi:protease IV